jgi:uncharacterized protein (DUF952 family)
VSDFILHATTKAAWSAAQASREYAADSLAGEGFIHCSTAEQIPAVAERFFAGWHGLVLLVIDPMRLIPELRWEAGADQPAELFPHIYGPINLEAVMDVLDFEPGPDGKFHLPGSLEIPGR